MAEFARFLEIDPDLVAVAAATSANLDDLREIATRRGNAADLDRRLAELRILHERKKAFLDQLVAKGL